jgi:hypothetical protein
MNSHEQDQNKEPLLMLLHEHWMVFLLPLSLYLVGLSLGAFLFWLGTNLHELAHPAAMVVTFIAYGTILIAHHLLFLYLLSLQLSGLAVTKRRIIDFRFFPYVRHDMSYINIQEINEIEKHQRGLIKNLLHYGEVEMNLPTSYQTLEFKYVPYPGRLIELVSRLQKSEKPITPSSVGNHMILERKDPLI